MTDITTSAVPAYLKSSKNNINESLAGKSSKRLGIRGSTWRLIDSGTEVGTQDSRALNVVIVNAAEGVGRSYYAKAWDEKEAGASSKPDCYSAKGDVPMADSLAPQSTNCATCPQNVKGSARSGGQARACRFNKKLAVVLESDIGGSVYQLVLPSTSIFGEGSAAAWPLQAYAKYLTARGVPITAVVTEMRFDSASSTPKVLFKATRFLEEAEHEVSLRQGESTDALRAVSAKSEEPVKLIEDDPLAVVPAHLEAKALAPSPEPKDEPVVISSKAEAPVIDRAKALEDALSEWDD